MLKKCKFFNIFFPQYLRKNRCTKRGQCGGGGTKPLDTDQAPRSHGLLPHVVARRRLPAAATTPREGISGLHIPTGDPPLEHKTDSPAPTWGRGAGGRGGEAHHPRQTRDPRKRGARAQRARALSGGRRQGTTIQFFLPRGGGGAARCRTEPEHPRRKQTPHADQPRSEGTKPRGGVTGWSGPRPPRDMRAGRHPPPRSRGSHGDAGAKTRPRTHTTQATTSRTA